MLKSISSLLLICLVIIFSGCASLSGSAAGRPKEPRLTWNVSYIRGLVLVQEALKSEGVQFGNAIINKDTAQLKGNYPDGRTAQFIISKLNNSESSLIVRVDNSQAPGEDAKNILEKIAQYAKQVRPPQAI